MTTSFGKIVNPGTVRLWDNVSSLVFVNIKFSDGRLSITGVEGPMKNGNCRGSCGQIRLSPDQMDRYADGWDEAKLVQLAEIWRRWHLNDTVAGTPAQMTHIRKKRAEAGSEYEESCHGYASKQGFASHYDMELAWLAEVDLVTDGGYRYGTKWLREEVPEEVLEWLRALPETTVTPAWV